MSYYDGIFLIKSPKTHSDLSEGVEGRQSGSAFGVGKNKNRRIGEEAVAMSLHHTLAPRVHFHLERSDAGMHQIARGFGEKNRRTFNIFFPGRGYQIGDPVSVDGDLAGAGNSFVGMGLADLLQVHPSESDREPGFSSHAARLSAGEIPLRLMKTNLRYRCKTSCRYIQKIPHISVPSHTPPIRNDRLISGGAI